MPSMTWDDLLACKLVVVGRYDSHKAGNMSIKVERVLRSPANEVVKVGDVIEVSLEHWWTVETGPVGFNAMEQDAKGDGKPRLCYKGQLMSPGPLVPKPVLEKEQSGIFFFPGRQAVLKRWLQLQPLAQAEGWQQALDGKPIDLSFRLVQTLNQKMHGDAIDELKTSRDQRIMAELIDTMANGPGWDQPSSALFHGTDPLYLLIAMGDKKGDLYDAIRARIKPTLKRQPPWPAYFLADILAQVDPARAVHEFRGWIKNPPAPEYKRMAVTALGWAGTEESLNLAMDMISDSETAEIAILSVRIQIGGGISYPGPVFTREQRAKLWGIAKARLTDPNPPGNLSKGAGDAYRWLVGSELNSSAPQR